MKGGVRDMARAAGLTKPQTEHSETTHPENHRVTESTIARYLISGYNHPRLRVGFFFHETSSKKDKKEKKKSRRGRNRYARNVLYDETNHSWAWPHLVLPLGTKNWSRGSLEEGGA